MNFGEGPVLSRPIFKPKACGVCGRLYVPKWHRSYWCSTECRLVANTDRSGGPDACWPWTGSRFRLGYGSMMLDGKVQSAHRVAYKVANGCMDLSPKIEVRHTCDNRPCCNPAHLVEGTHAENMLDMVLRGRMQTFEKAAKGSANGQAKITEETALAIFLDGRKATIVAASFGVPPNIVYRIRSGKCWSQVTGLPKKKEPGRRKYPVLA